MCAWSRVGTPSSPNGSATTSLSTATGSSTFETIDGAADAAGKHVQSRGVPVKGHKVVLLPYLHP